MSCAPNVSSPPSVANSFLQFSWEGIKAGDIFDGKVRRPPESKSFYIALLDAETGAAQGANLEWDTDEVSALELEAGEVLRLPPTPEQLSEWEAQGIKDEEDIKFEEEERKAVRALPPPPLHPRSKAASRSRPSSSASSFRSGIASGANSPELHASHPHSHPASPLSQGYLSPASAMSPPPPPPRRKADSYHGLGLMPATPLVEHDMQAPVAADDSLDMHRLSLDGSTSQAVDDAPENPARPTTPPPTFEEAVSRPSSPPQEKPRIEDNITTTAPAGEISEQRETLQVPPALKHQDSESSVSVYSDATAEETDGKEDSSSDFMTEVQLDGDHKNNAESHKLS